MYAAKALSAENPRSECCRTAVILAQRAALAK
eukprot:COSAG01_NODE_38608_length_487_cov_1.507732_1_plen_31_part_01